MDFYYGDFEDELNYLSFSLFLQNEFGEIYLKFWHFFSPESLLFWLFIIFIVSELDYKIELDLSTSYSSYKISSID